MAEKKKKLGEVLHPEELANPAYSILVGHETSSIEEAAGWALIVYSTTLTSPL